MAINLSTGIYGFICSVKKTVEGIYQKHFLSGAAGHGWEIGEKKEGKYCLEIDDIVVRNTMTVFELLISKIRAVKGALAITQASGKIESVWEDEENYYLTIEEDMSFVPYDWIRCQSFSHEQRLYHVMVHEVEGNVIVIPRYEFDDQPAVPRAGDELVQFGNRIDKRRQNAIYVHADENGIPAIDVMLGITSKDWSKSVKLRMGGGLPDAPAEWNGLYCENGLIKAVDEDHNEIYMLRPDGSGFLAKGNIRWDAEGNGAIFNDAIVWDENGFRFGPNISLSWNNLTDDARTNLKGDKGDKGEQGDPGTDGTDGKDGRDGEDGKDGVDGKDGKDANLLDWVEDWNGSTTYIDGNKLLTGRIFGGKQETDGSLTGVAMGYQIFKNSKNQLCSGIFGTVRGEPRFILDPEHNDYQFRGAVYADSGTIGKLEIEGGKIIGKDDSTNDPVIIISKDSLDDFSTLQNTNEVVKIYGDISTKEEDYEIYMNGNDTSRRRQTIKTTTSENSFGLKYGCLLKVKYELSKFTISMVSGSGFAEVTCNVKALRLFSRKENAYVKEISNPIENTIYPIEVNDKAAYYFEMECEVSIDYKTRGDSREIEAVGWIGCKLNVEAHYSTQCTLIGTDGFYSYWGPNDYFYAKRGNSGLEIKMSGDVEIRDRKGNLKLST